MNCSHIQTLTRVIVPFLIVAGVLLVVAQWKFTLFKYGFLTLFAVIVASLLLVFPAALYFIFSFAVSKKRRMRWINYLYIIRFSLLLWLIMPALALLDASWAPTAITLGIFTPESGWQLFYSAFFVKPKVARGLYFGDCPYCGAKMSATHYQEELGCPSCQKMVRVHDNKFETQ